MRKNIKNAIKIIISRFMLPRECECPLCQHKLHMFLPYRGGSRNAPQLMRVLEIVGSDLDRFQCPWCRAHDRERHLFLYLQASKILSSLTGKDILHFAPEQQLSLKLAEAKPRKYIKGDLSPQKDDILRVDILNMQFSDQSFDLLIANHVLEHVTDHNKALSEIYRVLKPGGHAILQTPYSSKLLHTFSDPGIDTEESRLQAYGQEDHVRLFGSDVFQAFESKGLKSMVKKHEEILPNIDCSRFGLNKAEPFFLFTKPKI